MMSHVGKSLVIYICVYIYSDLYISVYDDSEN